MIDAAIVGAGPYGLSVAAHLKAKGVRFRIFGHPMDSWLRHMPKDMFLKSDGFASTVSDPYGSFTLKHFCAERGIEYADLGKPVPLDAFAGFGLAFKDRFLPELEEKLVTGLERTEGGFRLVLDNGEFVEARIVVLAVGITHFAFMPPGLRSLPPEFASHSFVHRDTTPFRGRRVVVVGGGSSALDLAAQLHDSGAKVQIVARTTELVFHSKPQPGKRRSLWAQLRNPQSGLGPGLKSRFYSNWPHVFYYLPEKLRLQIVKTHLGPSGGWFIRDKIIDRVPLALGYSVEGAETKDGEVRLTLRGLDGKTREIRADHVIAATGYKVDLERLELLPDDLRARIKTVGGSPALSTSFESTIPGLYFVGLAAANSFGPLMRFAYGATFTARRLSQAVAKVLARTPAGASAGSVAAVAKS